VLRVRARDVSAAANGRSASAPPPFTSGGRRRSARPSSLHPLTSRAAKMVDALLVSFSVIIPFLLIFFNLVVMAH
jgi:hypothetical protein